MSEEHADGVVYRPLQAWSRAHAEDGVVTVHFATKEQPERKFTLTADAARELAIQLMRHSKRVRRAGTAGSEGDSGAAEEGEDPRLGGQ